MDSSTPGFPVLPSLLEFAQTHVHKLVMRSNHLILCHPLLLLPSIFPRIRERPFPMSWLFVSGDQSIGASASASDLPMNIQDWSPLGWIGLISLQCKGLSRVFSNTTIQKYQFSDTQLSLWSNSHVHTWLLEKLGVFVAPASLFNSSLPTLSYWLILSPLNSYNTGTPEFVSPSQTCLLTFTPIHVQHSPW